MAILMLPHHGSFIVLAADKTPATEKRGRVHAQGRIWGADEIATVLDNLKTKSASQIAAMLRDRSRNAVLGLVNRLKARGVLPQTLDKYIETPARKPPTRKRRRTIEVTPLRKLLQSDVTPPAPRNENHVTFAELTQWHCHWPIGDPRSPDFRYCGARKLAKVPYCAHHTKIAYTRERPNA